MPSGPWLKRVRGSARTLSPDLVHVRRNHKDAAIVFVHGFYGQVAETWSIFLAQLEPDRNLADWDIFSIGYPTSLSLDMPFWSADPELGVAARALSTKLALTPLDAYRCVALVAHSMGGLVVQRAILDDKSLRERLTHVLFYGTPSNGLRKVGLVKQFKHQLRDLKEGGPFITKLRADWTDIVGNAPPFFFRVIAGDTDAFVPPKSSIMPFPIEQTAAIPGNHLEIVRPAARTDLSYLIFDKALRGEAPPFSQTDSARLAVERKDFQKAVDILLPGANGLDAKAIVTLALALESIGRSGDAFKVLDEWNAKSQHHLDPLGALAGRLKRRWLVERQQHDLDRALELYSQGRDYAVGVGNHDQAYYHAINVAYLTLSCGADTGPVPQIARDNAELALFHARLSVRSQWSAATEGEAYLILGNLNSGLTAYEEAYAKASTIRERGSMYVQGAAIAVRVHGDEGRARFDAVFNVAQQ